MSLPEEDAAPQLRTTVGSQERSGEERFRLLFEHSPDAILLLDPHDPSGAWPIVDCNDEACRMNGYTHDELIGQSIDILRIHSTTPEKDQEYPSALRTRGSNSFETAHRHKAGHELVIEASSSRIMIGDQELILEIDRDITQRKLVERKLLDNQTFLEGTLNSLSDHVAIIDADGVIVSTNSAWRRFAEENGGFRATCSVAANYLEVCDLAAAAGDEVATKAAAGIRAVIEKREPAFSLEYPYHGADGPHWFVMNVSRFDHVGPLRIVIAHEDITSARLAAEHMRHIALHDPLTGLPNRALFHDHLRHAIARTRRHVGQCFAVLFLDLDRFKLINDSLGHLAGDLLLHGIARRLESCLRPSDIAARMGGDEFTILLDDINGVRDATLIADRLLRSLRAPFSIQNREIVPAVSIGLVLNKNRYEHPDELLRDADIALQRAKALGKDRYEVFDNVMHREVTARLRLEDDLRQMVARHEPRVLYQPIYDIADGSIVAVEALARWQHHDLGLLAPADFLLIADETGLLEPIGAYVLRQACQQARLWQHAGPRPVPLTINLSTRQLRRQGFVAMMAQVIDEAHLDPGLLQIELSEDSVLVDEDILITLQQELVGHGMRLIIDNFGTGHGSIGALAYAPISGIKLPRHFVTSLREGPGERLVPALIALAHGLDLKVTAVGVETADQLALLRFHGCDQAQGFLFSPPLTNDALVRLLQEGQQPDGMPSEKERPPCA